MSAKKEFDEYAHIYNDDNRPAIELYNILSALVASCRKFTYFEHIFKEQLGIEAGSLVYREFDRLMHEYIFSELMSEKKGDLKMEV